MLFFLALFVSQPQPGPQPTWVHPGQAPWGPHLTPLPSPPSSFRHIIAAGCNQVDCFAPRTLGGPNGDSAPTLIGGLPAYKPLCLGRFATASIARKLDCSKTGMMTAYA